MIFYTDVCGIPMAAVSLLMLISRFWDAINDPIIGSLSDRTKSPCCYTYALIFLR